MDSKSKSFKSVLGKWHLVFFLIAFVIIGLFSTLFFNGAIIALIIFLEGVVIYFLTWWLCKSTATVEVNRFNLTVSNFCKTLNVTEKKEFPVSDIRGFEIAEKTKGNESLFIYLKDFSCHDVYVSKIDDQFVLENFLSQDLKKINKDSNPKFSNFWSAYWFVLKRCFLFLAVCLPISTFVIIANQQENFYHSNAIISFILVPLISMLSWYFLFNKPVRNNYFRFGAFFWFSNFVFYLSPLLLFLIIGINNERIAKPITVNHINEIVHLPSHKFYFIKDINYNPSKLNISNYYVGSSGKSKYIPVHHYYLTPATNTTKIDSNNSYGTWLVKSFTQSIDKRDEENEKIKQANSYHTEGKTKFIALFNNKPSFYKEKFDDERAYQTLQGKNNVARRNIILEPFWETLDAYKHEILMKVFWITLLMFGVNILWCLFIASNR